MSSLLLPALHVAPSPAPPEDDLSSSEGSSIGSASSDAESESEIKDDITSSLGSLEDSLPIKKGLSNHFVGKSRSFTNLSECENGNAVDLAKGENPFNKRRRIQISYQRRASCSSLVTVPLPSLLSPEHALQEAEEENDDDDDGDDSGGGRRTGNSFSSLAPTPHGGNLFNGKIMIVNNGKVKIKSPRSFPLFDL